MSRAVASTHPRAGGSPNGRHRPVAAGFTLIELMVALAILTILLSSVYATFYAGMLAMQTRDETEDVYQIARLVMERITDDLSMAFYDPSRDNKDEPTLVFIGIDRSDGRYARDRLDLTTASHVLVHDGRPETDIAEVSYYIDETYTNRPLLVRREDPLPDRELRHGGTLRVLAEQVVALNLRYRQPGPPPTRQTQETRETAEDERAEEEAWKDEWNVDTDAGGQQGLPELVEITVIVRDAEDREHTFTSMVRLHPN